MKIVKERTYKLDLNKITAEASHHLILLDNHFIGTPSYMGVSYFWNYCYRHALRDNRKYWIKIHTKFLKSGLPVHGASEAHGEIISKYIDGDWTKAHLQDS